MQIVSNTHPAAQSRAGERGAALITVLLISMLLLAAGGTLIAVTSRSAVNAADATAESQAYYAAEAGLQGVLTALRGNVAPTPLSATASENIMTYRNAVTGSTSKAPGSDKWLSRWLRYDSTYTDRVILNSGYTPMSGMAYSVEEVRDPDSSDLVTFSASGAFYVAGNTAPTNNCPSSPDPCVNLTSGAGGGTAGFTLTYTPRPSVTLSTNGISATSDFGQLTISSVNGSYDIPPNTNIELTVAQTGPWGVSTKITARLAGNVNKTSGSVNSTLDVVYPQQSFWLAGVEYRVPATTQRISASGATVLPVQVLAPEPQRLLVRVKGYGPRNASKHLQMLVSRFGFSYTPKGAITLRSHDDSMFLPMTFIAGQSDPFTYDGRDRAGGTALPAFSVTHSTDYDLIINNPGANQMFGTPPVRKVPISELSDFLQTVSGANRALNTLRALARSQRWPSTCTGALAACDRYFGPGETPSDLGASQTNGLLTFVEGDLSLGSSTNGAGLLVVTGKLTLNGGARFNGVVLVIGEGKFVRQGGGATTSFGSLAVAKLGSTQFLNPHFETTGAGASGYQYHSEWVRKALIAAGPAVLGVSEY